jgi:ketosteroid isomerase-like protein
MRDRYLINLAKTEFREGYNTSNPSRVLSVFAEDYFDMSQAGTTKTGEHAKDRLRKNLVELFSEYHVKMVPIIIDIVFKGDIAYDYGWHELILTAKDSGEKKRLRHRYFELWRKDTATEWKISFFIDNADVPDQLAGLSSHWFFVEDKGRWPELRISEP